jgi:hypothetical protein
MSGWRRSTGLTSHVTSAKTELYTWEVSLKGEFIVRTTLAEPAVSRGLRGERHHEGGSKGEPHVVVLCRLRWCLDINEGIEDEDGALKGGGGNGVRVAVLEQNEAYKRGE